MNPAKLHDKTTKQSIVKTKSIRENIIIEYIKSFFNLKSIFNSVSHGKIVICGTVVKSSTALIGRVILDTN